ncbi:MAG TPA: pinensin family lanthipeptide [Luteibaculaceae bacterium]|nr:pinensin family lanthipeptide [Luteibaculaceae bacterium]
MNKKIKLDQLKVTSFITDQNRLQALKGGAPPEVNDETLYSCYQVITCNVVGCVLTQYDEHCYLGELRINRTILP